jgi:hypothetical protein
MLYYVKETVYHNHVFVTHLAQDLIHNQLYWHEQFKLALIGPVHSIRMIYIARIM